MKYYYLVENNQPSGPYSINELKSKKLHKNTLVWKNNMEDWQVAENIDELKEIIFASPPPLPKPIKKIKEIDIKTTRESSATFIGIVLLLISFIFPLIVENIQLVSIVFIIVRILVIFIVCKIASIQKRDSLFWGTFAFIFPAICLIIIGLLKYKIESLNENEQKRWIINAENKLENNQKNTAIEILNQLIDLSNSIEAKIIILFETKEYEKSKSNINFLIENNIHLSFAYYYLGKIEEKKGNLNLAISNWKNVTEDGYSLYYYDLAQKKIKMYK